MGFEHEERIYRKYADGLIRYATVLVGPSEAEDVVMEAVRKVLTAGGLAHADNAKAYLYRAVHNTAATATKRASAREAKERAAAFRDPIVSLGEVDLDVVHAVAELSTQQRAVVWLTYWDDLRPDAVAEILGVSVGSVKRHLARARAAIRKAMS